MKVPPGCHPVVTFTGPCPFRSLGVMWQEVWSRLLEIPVWHSPVNMLSCPHTHAALSREIRVKKAEQVVQLSSSRGNDGGTVCPSSRQCYFGVLRQLLTAAMPICHNPMPNRKPLWVLERQPDATEVVSQEDESGIDGPGDLQRGIPEMTAVCSEVEGKGPQLQLVCTEYINLHLMNSQCTGFLSMVGQKRGFAIPAVKGVGQRQAHVVLWQADTDLTRKAGELTEEERAVPLMGTSCLRPAHQDHRLRWPHR
ncbi:hypothetical protein GH733_009532, partial [Mirounga leonina]